jgi:putative transposase
MLATDYFHVDCAVTLRRLPLFATKIGSRCVHVLGVTANPDGPRTVQRIRNLLMDLGDRAADFRFLVRDRAGQFTAPCDAVLADAGIEAVKIPAPQPRANAYAKRFVLTVRTEVTDRILIFGQRHLRTVVAEHDTHYNRRRPPSQPPAPPRRPDHPLGRPFPGTDPAPGRPRRPHQRVRAGRIESQASTSDRVPEPRRRISRSAQCGSMPRALSASSMRRYMRPAESPLTARNPKAE